MGKTDEKGAASSKPGNETKKTASRFMLLEFIGPNTVNERGAEYRIVVDRCVGPKEARERAASKNIEGNCLVVCVHEDLIAAPKTAVCFSDRETGAIKRV